MGCGCGKGAVLGGSGIASTYKVCYSDGQTRNYLTEQEADAAVAASTGTANPGQRCS